MSRNQTCLDYGRRKNSLFEFTKKELLKLNQMTKFFTSLVAIIFAFVFKCNAQGWPSKYEGVMLQGFYWDSFSDSQWSNLEKQANELSAFFNEIWVPQSGYCNTTSMQMGYLPVWWFKHLSAFGSEAELRSFIKTLKSKGTGIIEDVVINHRAGNTNWCDFPTETWRDKRIEWSLSDICRTDDNGNTLKEGYKITGAPDTGDDFGGGRDLDHTSLNVRNNIKIYLDFLLNDLGYNGFRYDMVKGYAPQYIGEYNASAKPLFSVGEYWDGNAVKVKSWIDGTKYNNVIQSAAFDFPLKYAINDAFGSGKWYRLADLALANDNNYKRYAVTFVDNHDTGRSHSDGGAPLYANIAAANAYIMAMPGTPCVFLSHWKLHKTTIKKLIFARKACGLNNESEIISARALDLGFVLQTRGTKGNVMLVAGDVKNVDTKGFKLAVEGENFKYYVSENINISDINNIKNEDNSFVAPSFCKVNENEMCAFFEAPSNWGLNVSCWCWDKKTNYTGGTWPGVKCVLLGNNSEGKKVWKWTWNNVSKLSSATNSGIIFSNNSGAQTPDLPFTNGGYYTMSGLQGVVKSITASVYSVMSDSENNVPAKAYYINGVFINTFRNVGEALKSLPKGVYIINSKKYYVK